MKIGIIIQARMSSTRLPGKVMQLLANKEVLWHMVERCRKSKLVDSVIVATSTHPGDNIIENFCRKNSISVARGSLDNVLERYHTTARKFKLDTIVRVTSDCPLIDPGTIDSVIRLHTKTRSDYTTNMLGDTTEYPMGLAVEVFSSKCLAIAYAEATEDYEKEHVTPYIFENKKGKFKIGPLLKAPDRYKSKHRLTLDYPLDLKLFSIIYDLLYKPGDIISLKDALAFLDRNPDIARLNRTAVQKSYK